MRPSAAWMTAIVKSDLPHVLETGPMGVQAAHEASPHRHRWRRPLMRRVFAFAAVVAVVLVGGVSPASAATCPTTPTPVASVPPSPFGANVTIFDPSMSVTAINAALNAPANNQRRQF